MGLWIAQRLVALLLSGLALDAIVQHHRNKRPPKGA